MIHRLPGMAAASIAATRSRVAASIAALLACAIFVAAPAARGETPVDVRPSGDGVGIFIDGHLACWLGLQGGKLRGNISFTFTRDGLSCSIAPQAEVPYRRHGIARIERHPHVRPVALDSGRSLLFPGAEILRVIGPPGDLGVQCVSHSQPIGGRALQIRAFRVVSLRCL